MVVFEGGRRCPSMVFNEKILCGLGAELARTGRLSPQGCERAMLALHRFVALAPGLRVGALAGVATAAMREASDGAAFRDRIEEETGIRLAIASGPDEARLAALGVIFGDPAATGLVVDLGGASMEFCPVSDGTPGQGITTPLGPQLLTDQADRDAARTLVGQILAPIAREFGGAANRLYLVGGAWRAFGRAQIDRSDYPLDILHEYLLSPDEARATAGMILDRGEEYLATVPGLSSSRIASLLHAALLLPTLIEQFGPEDLMISGFGLREGMCFEYLPEAIRLQDPLISTCAGQERTRARAPGFGTELADWMLSALAGTIDVDERLIRAACHLVDVSWRAHPDFLATACIEAVTRVNVSSAGHRGRAFLAAFLLCRYRSGPRALTGKRVAELLSEAEQEHATAIGALMRLGCTIAGATPGSLPHVPLHLGAGNLTLKPDRRARIVMGEEVDKRHAQAARTLGVTPRIVARD